MLAEIATSKDASVYMMLAAKLILTIVVINYYVTDLETRKWRQFDAKINRCVASGYTAGYSETEDLRRMGIYQNDRPTTFNIRMRTDQPALSVLAPTPESLSFSPDFGIIFATYRHLPPPLLH